MYQKECVLYVSNSRRYHRGIVAGVPFSLDVTITDLGLPFVVIVREKIPPPKLFIVCGATSGGPVSATNSCAVRLDVLAETEVMATPEKEQCQPQS